MPPERLRSAAIFAVAVIAFGVALALALGRWSKPSLSSEPTDEAQLARMLASDDATQRASACGSIARSHLTQFAAALVPRLSDDDWRVRAAAFEALRDIGGERLHFDQPLRDTPVDDRERIILTALAQWRSASGDALPKLPPICELYPTLNHWLVGPLIMPQCQSCHAPSPRTFESSANCASCHVQVHHTWARSAHAASVSHLPLARVDPVTKQVVLWNHGAQEGLACSTCHQERHSIERASSLSPPVPPLASSRHRFDRSTPAAAHCADCHIETQDQYQTWRSHPRPQRAPWPPGAIELTDSPAKTCVDCHMPDNRDDSHNHGFVARRDPQLLRDGLDARLDPGTHQSAARLVLTNLSGHSYPAGTHRRSLRIEVLYDDDATTRHLLGRLKQSDPVPTSQPTQPILAPGEQRAFDLPARQGATRITAEITYERNGYVDPGYQVTLYRLSADLR